MLKLKKTNTSDYYNRFQNYIVNYLSFPYRNINIFYYLIWPDFKQNNSNNVRNIIIIINRCFPKCLIYRNQMNFSLLWKIFRTVSVLFFSSRSQWAIFHHVLISFFNVIVRLKLFHGHSSTFPYVHLPGKARAISLSLTLTRFWHQS